jgi:hypothetical protein
MNPENKKTARRQSLPQNTPCASIPASRAFRQIDEYTVCGGNAGFHKNHKT